MGSGASDVMGSGASESSETLWLTDGQQRHWRAYLRGSRLLETLLDRDLQAQGVQLSEYEIISMLSEASDRHLRMSEIAELVVQSRSRLTHTAARLEKRGWVVRQPCRDDRRGVELVLTPAGQAAIAAMAPLHVASVRAHFLGHLSPEQLDDLGAAMAAIRDGIAAEGQQESRPDAQQESRPDAQQGSHPDARSA